MAQTKKNTAVLRSFRNEPDRFVEEAIGGGVAAHPDAEWHPAGFIHRSAVVTADDGAPAVAVISGGGSGHEPLHGGFIGKGMLAAACPGNLFTSPNAVQIAEATRWADNGRGVLHVVKNYTGDVMNFAVARQLNPHIETATVTVAEDIASESKENGEPGRRGTAATVLVEKVAGAAAQRRDDLETVRATAQWVADNSRSMAVALAPGHLPTTGQDTFDLGPGEMETGVGIHGERGVGRGDIPFARDIADRVLTGIVDALDLGEREEVVCLVNGLGGATLLEIHLVFGEVLSWLQERGIRVRRSVTGIFVTSLNMHGISITLTRCTDEIAELLDASTSAPAWPNVIGTKETVGPARIAFEERLSAEGPVHDRLSAFVERAQGGVDALTELDRLAGDGDFGANINAAVGDIELPLRGSEAAIFGGLAHRFLIRAGGTSGAVFGLIFSELARAVDKGMDTPSLARGLRNAYWAIHELGGVEYGDKTMVDALFPAAEAVAALDASVPVEEALEAARRAAVDGIAHTRDRAARKGRASYLGESTKNVPDPGAIVVAWLFGHEGLVESFRWVQRCRTHPLHCVSMTTEGPAHRYTAALANEIERKWQAYWRDNGTFNAPNPAGDLATGEPLPEDKLNVQDMFPYPSGAGLHVGHPLGYIATDVFARYNRMLGKNVLHTLGYDAFGLPAEQYAIQTGTHPRTTTEANIANMTRQLDALGLGHDRRRSVATTDKEFYRWTQWIFLQIYNAWFDEDQQKARPIEDLVRDLMTGARTTKDGRNFRDLTTAEKHAAIDEFRLVYLSDLMVNWCPGLGTVLANEEVTAEGRSERGNYPVFRKRLRQWMMRITAYSDRLLDDLDLLDWPEKVKSMQRNWIGRSRGAQVKFGSSAGDIEVFTTRPDTLFGASYVVLAPEHELVDALIAPSYPADVNPDWTYGQDTPAEAVAAYKRAIAAKSDVERQENKEKTGVFLGTFATNPVNGEKVPVFIADYVLTGYGTGAIMAVPAHDERDYEFASVFNLPIVPVLESDVSKEAFTGDAPHVNSANDAGLDLNGKGKEEAIEATISWLVARGAGEEKVQYKLRDWLFARQRYWGEPFPIVYDENGQAHSLPEDMLPVELPEVEDYNPVAFDPDDADSEPAPPLAKATDWVEVTLDLGEGEKTYYRDTNVMPQWAGSSWYQLRYIDPTNSEQFCALENERYWTGPRGENDPGGVDLYVGGVEHAVLHLLYARFWHKVLYDLGFVTSREPYRRLYNQGYIQAYAYTDSRGVYVPAAEVEERDGTFFYQGQEVTQEYGKMGKSLKNAVAPDEIGRDFGADTLRVYEMSMGPLDTSRPWATKDVVGSHRFLQRLWRLVVDEATGELLAAETELSEDDAKALHRTIAGVREDYENLRDNTVVAKLIEYVNYLTKAYFGPVPRAAVEPLVQMVSPLAPHIAEELWARLGHEGTITFEPFPTFDESLLVDDSIEVPVQINGKVKARITVPADADEDTMGVIARADARVTELTEGKNVVKTIVVPGRMVNLVVK